MWLGLIEFNCRMQNTKIQNLLSENLRVFSHNDSNKVHRVNVRYSLSFLRCTQCKRLCNYVLTTIILKQTKNPNQHILDYFQMNINMWGLPSFVGWNKANTNLNLFFNYIWTYRRLIQLFVIIIGICARMFRIIAYVFFDFFLLVSNVVGVNELFDGKATTSTRIQRDKEQLTSATIFLFSMTNSVFAFVHIHTAQMYICKLSLF